ncbi:hypothetical protein XENTR_v10023440 [Xenopus tropicalis]|nr:hypothetical protein XENTR_v10023440 [Xenopus tropicalis]
MHFPVFYTCVKKGIVIKHKKHLYFTSSLSNTTYFAVASPICNQGQFLCMILLTDLKCVDLHESKFSLFILNI